MRSKAKKIALISSLHRAARKQQVVIVISIVNCVMLDNY
nr:MAG TPA: hypothetical protein [Caudoviricetes sp.]